MKVIRRWKKFLALGCSHGHLADQDSLKTVLRFKKAWKPDTTIHLGDFVDLAALRSGAKGTKDEGSNLQDDLEAGLRFLRQLEPTHVFDGNHEDRLRGMIDHPKAIISYCASQVVGEITEIITSMKAEYIPYSIKTGWREFGRVKFGHGYMFSEAAIRDHAESIGSCVIAHLHRVGEEPGRHIDSPIGRCVGCLADIPAMTYAKTRRATFRWSQGFAWGEYCDDECVVRLERKTEHGWRLPL